MNESSPRASSHAPTFARSRAFVPETYEPVPRAVDRVSLAIASSRVRGRGVGVCGRSDPSAPPRRGRRDAPVSVTVRGASWRLWADACVKCYWI
jgi:hypothetical protein